MTADNATTQPGALVSPSGQTISPNPAERSSAAPEGASGAVTAPEGPRSDAPSAGNGGGTANNAGERAGGSGGDNQLQAELDQLRAENANLRASTARPDQALSADLRAKSIGRTITTTPEQVAHDHDEPALQKLVAAAAEQHDGLKIDNYALLALNRDRLDAEAQARGFASAVYSYPVTAEDGSQSTATGYLIFPGTQLRVE